MIGTWRAVLRGWRVFVPVVILNAAVQALLVVGDPEPVADPLFAALVALSFVVLVAALALVVAASDGAFNWPSGSVLLWSVVVVVAIVGLSFVSPLLVPPAIVAAALSSAAADHPWRGFIVFRHRPVRSILAILVALVIVAVGWVVSLLLGFFVTGALASGITWLWFGVTGVVLVCWFGARYRRASLRIGEQTEFHVH